MKEVTPKGLHGLMIRFSDNYVENSKSNTIIEHNKMIEKNGFVYLGKFGRRIGAKSIKLFNDSTLDRYLILASRSNGKYKLFIARVDSVKEDWVNKNHVPSYYRKESGFNNWFCIRNEILEMGEEEVNQWVVKSSKFSLKRVLSTSMAGFFIVSKGEAIDKYSPLKPSGRGKGKKQKTSDIGELSNGDDFYDIDDFLW